MITEKAMSMFLLTLYTYQNPIRLCCYLFAPHLGDELAEREKLIEQYATWLEMV